MARQRGEEQEGHLELNQVKNVLHFDAPLIEIPSSRALLPDAAISNRPPHANYRESAASLERIDEMTLSVMSTSGDT